MARFWVCETCGSRKKGPDRPRKNASVRYCFPCSETKGTLVERVCPSLRKQKDIRKKRKQARRERLQIRQGHRYEVDGINIDKRLEALVKLPCWRDCFKMRGYPELSIRWSKAYPYGVSGSAHDDDWRVCMTIGVEASYEETEETLIHELAHLAVGCYHHHGKVWKKMLQEAMFQAWGVLAQGRTIMDLDINAIDGISAVRSIKKAA